MEGKDTFKKPQLYFRILLLVLLLAGTVLLIFKRDKFQDLEIYGYPGVFLILLLSNATIIIPLPGVMITSAMAVAFDPFRVAIAFGTGAVLGELSGYLAIISLTVIPPIILNF